MKAIECAFEFQEDNKMPIGSYQHIDCHMIFHVKITLNCKTRYVAGGQHQTEPSKDVTFLASVISWDSIHIASTWAALVND